METKLEPIVKWTGGKTRELKYILPNLPKHFENYYEPFVGGGAVYTKIQAKESFINDKAYELISIYQILKSSESAEFFAALQEITDNWDILGNILNENKTLFVTLYKKYLENRIGSVEVTEEICGFVQKYSAEFHLMFSTIFNYNSENFIKEIHKNLTRKIKRMKVLDFTKQRLDDKQIADNIEAGLKSAFYTQVKHLYNSKSLYDLNESISAAIFLFIRNFAYSGMFRYNAKGDFNVPYGGIGYNRKNFGKKVDYLKSDSLHKHLQNTIIESVDFECFFEKHSPTKQDFIFLDPPYDTEFSTYAQNEFNRNDQKRLANYLINHTKAKWMLVIKNTEFILNLYNTKGLNIAMFDKTYSVNFMNRNDKQTEHLVIRNYHTQD